VSMPTEQERRTFNIMEALVIAALLGMASMLFFTRDAVIKLQVT
jgi:hypothetical protein